eukprot:TRINITY_DN10944_c0_g1_i1.p1 TRINITY_DN10944_c0_g1~~TRINITY_DN10944_c0_g1_i1.p1  ORF type:complete len:66 (+),score=15.32 TRINITY_DN10944_c0_g1_i1:488-685(+)
MGRDQTASWKLGDSFKPRFRCFRIRQTGPNSNDHQYLALSGFELYGHMFMKPNGRSSETAKAHRG